MHALIDSMVCCVLVNFPFLVHTAVTLFLCNTEGRETGFRGYIVSLTCLRILSMKCTVPWRNTPPAIRTPFARKINNLAHLISRVPRDAQRTPGGTRSSLPPLPALPSPRPASFQLDQKERSFNKSEAEVEAMHILEYCVWLHASAVSAQLPEAVDHVVTKILAPRVLRLADMFHHWPSSSQDGDLSQANTMRTILDAAVVNFVMGVRIWGLMKLSEPLDGVKDAVAEWDDASYLWESIQNQPSSQLFGFPLGYQRKLLLSMAVCLLGCGCSGPSNLPTRWDDRLRILALAHVVALLRDVKEEGGCWEELGTHMIHKLRVFDNPQSHLPIHVIAQLRPLLPPAAPQQWSDRRPIRSSRARPLNPTDSCSGQLDEFSKIDLKLLLARSKVVLQRIDDGDSPSPSASVHPLSLMQLFRNPVPDEGKFTGFDESLLVRDAMLSLGTAGTHEVSATLEYCLKGAVALERRRAPEDDPWRRNLQMLARLSMDRIGMLVTMPKSHPTPTSEKREKEQKERRHRQGLMAQAQDVVDSLMLLWDWNESDLPPTFRAAAQGCCQST